MLVGSGKVLVCHTRALCYYSAGFFSDKIEESLKNRGVETLRVEIPEDSDSSDYSILENLENENIKAVIDINSRLPYLIDDNGDFWLDSLGAPFFNYILDHPLYHFPGLSIPLKNYHAIGIDNFHCDYIKRCHPHIKSIHMLPLAGSRALSHTPFRERRFDLFFSGTYIPESTLEGELSILKAKFGPVYMEYFKDLISLWEPQDMTLEACLGKYLKDRNLTAEEAGFNSFPELLNALYPVDRIKRNSIREKILSAISKELPLTIMGEGWEESCIAKAKNIKFLPPQNYINSLSAMANSKMILDINPAFLSGIHDRVSNALANESLCITNMSGGFDENLLDGRDIIYFSHNDMEGLLERLAKLSDSEKMDIAGCGYEYYLKELTWEEHALRLKLLFTGNSG